MTYDMHCPHATGKEGTRGRPSTSPEPILNFSLTRCEERYAVVHRLYPHGEAEPGEEPNPCLSCTLPVRRYFDRIEEKVRRR